MKYSLMVITACKQFVKILHFSFTWGCGDNQSCQLSMLKDQSRFIWVHRIKYLYKNYKWNFFNLIQMLTVQKRWYISKKSHFVIFFFLVLVRWLGKGTWNKYYHPSVYQSCHCYTSEMFLRSSDGLKLIFCLAVVYIWNVS